MRFLRNKNGLYFKRMQYNPFLVINGMTKSDPCPGLSYWGAWIDQISKIDRVSRWLAEDDAAGFLGGFASEFDKTFSAVECGVRSEEDVGPGSESVVVHGFAFENVDTGTGDMARGQCFHQVVLLDHGSAGGVDEISAFGEFGECLGVDQVLTVRIQIAM